MKLEAYLRHLRVATTSWARENSLNPTMVLRIIGGGDASGKNWARIWYATNGNVSPWDYFDARGRRR